MPVALALMLGACSMVPDYARPETGTPDAWSGPRVAGMDVAADTQWWNSFGDPELTLLMQVALANNLDIEQALARVEQARGAARAAGSSLLPQVSGSGSASSRSVDGGSMSDSSQIGLSASYALDIWGRYRAQAQSADLSLVASEFDGYSAALIVQSQVATTYFTILALKDRIAIAEESLAAARDTLRIVEARYNAGSISGLDLAQQRNAVATIEASLPSLRAQEAANENALAILLARVPGRFAVEGETLDKIALPAIAAGQPSELLERRPDIRSAEARLLAANANIGAARAAFFPSLDLSASVTRSFAGGVAETASALGASLLAPIFSGGSLEGNLQSAEGRQVELAANYKQTVLTSFAEVENALVNADANALREASLAVAADEARRAYDLAQARYRSGASDLLSVLDAQRSWLSARDSAAQARLNRYSSAVDLFVALGGGWRS
ncbi:efflux transporter outer membrane subunit [Parvibaculum lavamentivorans]|uniref:efflux transporter outer membrane subunit n=1 Tax=Parvibaculum lavamentivorans TaxID=256618 RepID=UPI000309FFEA|nr:efflux transporter outer membrane subunit [Parvibaculum lavamentivorans]